MTVNQTKNVDIVFVQNIKAHYALIQQTADLLGCHLLHFPSLKDYGMFGQFLCPLKAHFRCQVRQCVKVCVCVCVKKI